MKAYFISGLGADGRVFRNIRLPAKFEPVFLDWIEPVQGETLCNYAVRLSDKIAAEEPFVLIGLSMGGMIATEISRRLLPKQTILISSAATSEQLPFYFRWGRWVPLHRMVPISILKTGSFIKRFFSNETSVDKKLLRQIIADSDPAFIRWAMDAVVHWDCSQPPASLVHIHGTADRILPYKYARPTHTIKGAGHMMVVEHASAINKILSSVL